MELRGQRRIMGFRDCYRVPRAVWIAICSAFVAGGIWAAANELRAAPIDSPPINISIRIVRPISISRIDDLLFGGIIPGNSVSTISVAPNSTVVPGGPATFIGPFQPAAFRIAGEPAFRFTIDIPSVPIEIFSGVNKMMVVGWSKNLADTSTLPPAGFVELKVGATLSIGKDQPTGTYMGTFQVSVAYE